MPAARSAWWCTATPKAPSSRRALADWLQGMALVDAGHASQLDRYVGYYASYATSHRALDAE